MRTEASSALRSWTSARINNRSTVSAANNAALPAIVQIANRHATFNELDQCGRDLPISPIAGREHGSDDVASQIGQEMEFETKEPTFARFTKVSPVSTQQPHSPVAQS